MPPNPLESFLLLKLPKINCAEKNTLKEVTKFGAPSIPENFSECAYAPDMKHFQRAYLGLFPGLIVVFV